MKNYPQKVSSFIMSVVLVCALVPFQAAASYEIPGSCYVQTDTSAAGTVKTLDYAYANNTRCCHDTQGYRQNVFA